MKLVLLKGKPPIRIPKAIQKLPKKYIKMGNKTKYY